MLHECVRLHCVCDHKNSIIIIIIRKVYRHGVNYVARSPLFLLLGFH